MKSLYILVLLAIAVQRVYPSSIGKTRSSDVEPKQYISVIEGIIEAAEEITDQVGLHKVAETVEAIKRVADDIDRVNKEHVSRKLIGMNKQILDIKKTAKNNGIKEVPCLDKIEGNLRSNNFKTVSELQDCTHQLMEKTQGVAIPLANLQDKLGSLKEDATDMIQKCKDENTGPAGAVECINRHIYKYLTDIKELTNKVKQELDTLTSKQKEIIEELRQCSNQILDENEAFLRETDKQLDKCASEVSTPPKKDDFNTPENQRIQEIQNTQNN